MGALEERLSELAGRGSPACAALWAERQEEAAALESLAARPDPLSRLQYARLLCARDRLGDVADVLGGLGALPLGLEPFRSELTRQSSAAGGGDTPVPIAEPEQQGAPGVDLQVWLTRVQAWRETLRV